MGGEKERERTRDPPNKIKEISKIMFVLWDSSRKTEGWTMDIVYKSHHCLGKRRPLEIIKYTIKI